MSWNSNTWNEEDNGYGGERGTPSQWKTQQATNEDDYSCRQPQVHSYQRWKNVNGVELQGQTTPTQPYHHTQAYTQFAPGQPRHDDNVRRMKHSSAKNFNFTFRSNTQSGTQADRNKICSERQYGRGHVMHDHFPDTQYSQNDRTPFEISNNGRERNFKMSSSRAPRSAHDNTTYHQQQIATMPNRESLQTQNARYAPNNNLGYNNTPIHSAKFDQQPVNAWGNGSSSASKQPREGPLTKKLKSSMRIVTCTAEGIHHWMTTLGEDVPLVFELFGTVTAIDYNEHQLCFTLKGRTLDIQCMFYCMDQESPWVKRNDSVRAVGRLNLNTNQFQCISLRCATRDEKAFGMKLVQSCDSNMHRFNMSRNEM